MSEQEVHHENEPAAYDVHAVEDEVAAGLGRAATRSAPTTTARARSSYALTMFPYPSGDLHMGHAEVTALHDVVARYWWQQGYEVLNPMGWDSFGLPAENAAIRNNEHPATYTYANIETQYESFKKYGVSFDWSRRLHTSDPEYYRWTQWLFLKFRERGLAYRKNSPVNWCPNDQTVLANEQVVDGRCERCGAEVTKRELTQWYFKITEYAQRLLDDMEPLNDTWPERVLNAQRNWIGRSEGAHVDFEIEGHEPGHRLHDPPRHAVRCDVLRRRCRRDAGRRAGRRRAAGGVRGLPGRGAPGVRHRADVDRAAEDRRVPGRARDQPGHRREQIPVYAADYVLADYGTGAIMAVPGQDQRDWDFAKKFDLPIVRTVQPAEGWEGDAYTGDGPAVNSANDEISLDGMAVAEAKRTIIAWLEEQGPGRAAPSTSGCATGC